ncbi:MAG: DUF4292 domain-containing protein [Saprospiraceae bacterium]|nr:DUF4292 domain-containing protein [Saprospiraceae bacterium]
MKLIPFILLLLSFASCKIHKKTQEPVKPSTTVNTTETTTPPASQTTDKDNSAATSFDIGRMTEPMRIDFKSAELTGNMILENTTDKYNFTFNIRMLKDSLVWMQLKKYGLEGARILINKDSMFVIDRLHRSYIKKSWKDIRTEINAPVDFNILCDLLTGNPYYMKDGADSLQTTENMKLITNSKQNNRISIGINAVSEVMTQYMISDPLKDVYLKMNLDDYKILYDKKKFSYLRDLEIISNNVKLLYINLAFDEVVRNTKFKTPFEIPVGYKPMD